MADFTAFGFVKWLHLLSLAMGGGAMMVILILVGLEESRADLHGMTSLLWKRTAAWALRVAVLAGIVLLSMRLRAGEHPFDANYLHWKLALVLLLLLCSELSARSLAQSKRGLPLLAFMFFLLVTFVSVNHEAFGMRHRHLTTGSALSGAVEQGSDSGK